MSEWKHLRRLERVSISHPVYFITTCVHGRRNILTDSRAVEILLDEWANAHEKHGWLVGRYVIMPDHVHFFCCETGVGAQRVLSAFINQWKTWTARRISKCLKLGLPIWQREFFDHVLRTSESYAEKWEYVQQNPVRAGLAKSVMDWPYAGSVDFDSPLSG